MGISAGRLDRMVIFQAETQTSDGAGGYSLSWSTVLTAWAEFRPERGRERIEAGRLEAALGGVLRVRSSVASRAITEGNRVLIPPTGEAAEDGETYQIRSISDPDRQFREMTVEKGVAT
jgi:SPP1 family predicted phage head-tail adaptor